MEAKKIPLPSVWALAFNEIDGGKMSGVLLQRLRSLLKSKKFIEFKQDGQEWLAVFVGGHWLRLSESQYQEAVLIHQGLHAKGLLK